MEIPKNKLLVFSPNQEEIESIIDKSKSQILGTTQLKKLVQNIVDQKHYASKITIDELNLLLIEKSHLRRIEFRTPRLERLYVWRTVDPYKLLPVLRPNGYYSHLTALYLHHLLNYEPESIYFNNEQPTRPASGNLEQSRIDNAFRVKQRITTAKTKYQDKVFWLLNGKQTGNYSVVQMKTPNDVVVHVTDLERTLIDITVRPAYAGGVVTIP
jgi:predicted transcriptional regulator of viral defense system